MYNIMWLSTPWSICSCLSNYGGREGHFFLDSRRFRIAETSPAKDRAFAPELSPIPNRRDIASEGSKPSFVNSRRFTPNLSTIADSIAETSPAKVRAFAPELSPIPNRRDIASEGSKPSFVNSRRFTPSLSTNADSIAETLPAKVQSLRL